MESLITQQQRTRLRYSEKDLLNMAFQMRFLQIMELNSLQQRIERAKHKFREFLKENGIRHILARVNHPQTNGKIERLFGLMEQKICLFESLDEFVHWYNYVKPHMSLNFDELETPYQAFLRKLPAERVFEYGGGCLRSEIISGYHNGRGLFYKF